MRNIIGLLVVIPLISWVLEEDNYVENMMSIFHKFINTSPKFYFTLVSLTQVLAYFLLFASINTMYQFLEIFFKNKNIKLWEYYKGTALLRGFSFTTLWVVTVPSFVVVVDTLGASIYLSIAQGFVISLLGTMISILYMSIKERKHDVNLTPILQKEINTILLKTSINFQVQKQKVIEFFFLFFTLFGAIFFIYSVLHVPLLIITPPVIIGWVITFYIYKRRAYKLITISREYVTKVLDKQTYQLTLMLSVGILVYALNQTRFAVNVVGGLDYIESHVSLLNPLYLLPFIVIILSLIGLGPLTVMVLVASLLDTLPLPYLPELIVLSITSGSVIAILTSPLLIPPIILSASNGLSVFTNGIKSNWKFCLSFYIVTQVYIQLMIQFT